MKKLIVLFSALTLILTSCSSDDDSTSDINADIVGTWVGTEMVYEGTSETEIYGLPIEIDFTGEAYDISTKLIFSENPNTLVSEGSYSIKLEYEQNGITETQVVEDQSFLASGTWELNGDTLIVEDVNDSFEAKVYELTDDKLVIGITQTEDIEVNGIITTTTVNITATYIR